jgi:hypothetical protein
MDKLYYFGLASHTVNIAYGDTRIEGPNIGMHGNTSGLHGDCTWITGDCSGVTGNCTHLSGELTGMFGDLNWITKDQRDFLSWLYPYSTEVKEDG